MVITLRLYRGYLFYKYIPDQGSRMKRAPKNTHQHGKLTSAQLSARSWPDFEKLFAANGGVWGGCWCMFFHKPSEFNAAAYSKNKEAKHALVNKGEAHGTMVYCRGEPVGWCQFGPREELPRIDGKRNYIPSSDDLWRVTCLFIAPRHRKLGVAGYAVKESVKAMQKLKVKLIEAYPVEGERGASLLWMGTPHLFEDAGFKRVGPLGKSSWVYSLDLYRR
jgi:GNAT superfamily N-acetyltransferase